MPDRVVTCDCSRSNDPSLVQTIFLLNDANFAAASTTAAGCSSFGSSKPAARSSFAGNSNSVEPQQKPGGQVAAKPLNQDELIRSVFLRTVGHPPDLNENLEAHKLFASAKTPVDGARTLLWTMVNTKEFIVNHCKATPMSIYLRRHQPT